MNSEMSYPVLFLVLTVTALVSAWFAVLGARRSAAFEAPYWVAFSATMLSYVLVILLGILVHLSGLAAQIGGNGLIVLLPVVLLLVTALCHGFLLRYPRGEGAVGVGLGARIAIYQLGLTAIAGMIVVAGFMYLPGLPGS